MTDEELTKLAAQRCADLANDLRAINCGPEDFSKRHFPAACAFREYVERAHHAAVEAKAKILGKQKATGECVGDAAVIAALDALILTPPVDPITEKIDALIDEIAPASINPMHTAVRKSAMQRLIDELPKHGLELRASDGGGA